MTIGRVPAGSIAFHNGMRRTRISPSASADPERVLKALSEESMGVAEISGASGLPFDDVREHLRIFEALGLVSRSQESDAQGYRLTRTGRRASDLSILSVA